MHRNEFHDGVSSDEAPEASHHLRCLLLALSRHRGRRWTCPRWEVRRTPLIRGLRSANDPKRT